MIFSPFGCLVTFFHITQISNHSIFLSWSFFGIEYKNLQIKMYFMTTFKFWHGGFYLCIILLNWQNPLFLHCKDIMISTFGNFNMICDVFSASLPSRCAFHSEMVNNIFHLYLRVIPLSFTKCQISHLANLSYNAASANFCF